MDEKEKQKRYGALKQIKDELLALTSSPLYKYRMENKYFPVIGEGSHNARIMFVGEAPGKNEDLQGIPFVGASGKFLNEMLEMIGLERKDIYITNIVKYRPPNNRDPLPDEKASFLPYLVEQLTIIKPKVIVTLGRHSMDVLLPGLIISQEHGIPRKYEDVTYLPLFHPAAAMYNGKLRQTLFDDFAKIPEIISQLETN